ncbi:MAG: PrsW family intramembrane metalloprotease [Clostridiales bacterium]|nr:PrsW family intramembrane metalloprotease [Clostridiales bacterium]
MLFALALIPVIALLIFIYVNDKKEKEPIGLLLGLFFAGMGTVITAVIAEAIGQFVLDLIFPYESVLKVSLFALIIVGPAEELGKYMVLRLITWNNKNYNYSYDAIVYSVFVSLGFACIENVGYVFSYGIGTAFLRMFTAVPGHACFAVFMGFFYSKAKYAKLTNNKKAYSRYNTLTILVPIIGHGIYDAIVFAARQSDVALLTGLGVIVWIGYVIAMFVISFILILRSAKNDFCIVTLTDKVQTVYKPRVIGSWTCSCGTVNNFNFCSQCGKQRPMVNNWNCPKCGTLSTFNFCGNCGCPRPTRNSSVAAPTASSSASSTTQQV